MEPYHAAVGNRAVARKLATAAAQRKVFVIIAAFDADTWSKLCSAQRNENSRWNLNLLELSLLQTCALLHPGHRALRANTYDGIRVHGGHILENTCCNNGCTNRPVVLDGFGRNIE